MVRFLWRPSRSRCSVARPCVTINPRAHKPHLQHVPSLHGFRCNTAPLVPCNSWIVKPCAWIKKDTGVFVHPWFSGKKGAPGYARDLSHQTDAPPQHPLLRWRADVTSPGTRSRASWPIFCQVEHDQRHRSFVINPPVEPASYDIPRQEGPGAPFRSRACSSRGATRFRNASTVRYIG